MFFDYLRTLEKYFLLRNKPLSGITIWLCGSIPENESWSHPLVDRDILEFTSVFSSLVFKYGGTIVHGSHPNLTPILKRSAARFAKSSNQLELYISEMFVDDKIREKGKFCELIVQEIKNINGKSDRNESLTLLRLKMSSKANVAVFIGGKYHHNTNFTAGVPEEFDIAKERNIPSYVLAGIEGKAQDLACPDILKSMNPFSSYDEIAGISFEKNLSLLPSRILGSIIKHKSFIIKPG